ncbi:hypothetical protein BG000_011466 [Podila horticola]|nr:hypothetical protein BG000_011466 [Podila horticola]
MLSAGLLRAQGVRTLSGPGLRVLRFPQLLSHSLKVLCAIDGTREPFQVDINDSDTFSDIQENIKLKQPIRLHKLQASDLILYKAPKRGDITEPGVTVGVEDEISANSSLHGMFAQTNAVQVIVRPLRYRRSPLNIVQYDSRSGDLVWREDTFRSFPVHDVNDFKILRHRPELSHFHGREHLPDYKPLFEGLAIDEHVKKGDVNPGRYFVLQVDFSSVDRSQDREAARHSLSLMLNRSIMQFYRTYEPYLRMSADYLIENFIKDDATASLTECVNVVHDVLASVDSPDDPLSMIKGIYVMADEYDSYSNEYLVPIDSVQWKPPQRADTDSLLKGFWASVKSGLGYHKIAKCYITGVSPQSLVDNTSGFNVARYVSWHPKLAGFCGLMEADVVAALTHEKVCRSSPEAEKHLKIIRDHFNGFNFVPRGQGPLTYNTNTCLEYLQSLVEGMPMEDPLSVTNSEASEVSLRLLAAASLEDVDGAFKLLIEDGYIDKIIGLYARGMQQHDVGAHDFQKKEEDHCNSMRFTLLANIHPSLRNVGVETTITKPSGTPGRIDMLVSVPLRKRLFVLEWKSIQIDYIKIGSGTRLERAKVLADISNASEVLDLKFRNGRFRDGQTIKDWIQLGTSVGKERSPQQQLHEYVQSPEIERWKKDGYTITPVLVVVIGSRHVLLWNSDGDKLDASPRLALE